MPQTLNVQVSICKVSKLGQLWFHSDFFSVFLTYSYALNAENIGPHVLFLSKRRTSHLLDSDCGFIVIATASLFSEQWKLRQWHFHQQIQSQQQQQPHLINSSWSWLFLFLLILSLQILLKNYWSPQNWIQSKLILASQSQVFLKKLKRQI